MASEPEGVIDSDTVLDDKAEELKSNSVHMNMNSFYKCIVHAKSMYKKLTHSQS